MKLLYVSGTYYPAAGGAEISMHTFLKEAVKRGHNALVATDLGKINSGNSSIEYCGVKVTGLNHDFREVELSKILDSFQPDWIITQLMWSDVALKIANENRIKSILRFCKIPAYLDISRDSEFSPTHVMVVSDYVREYVAENWNRESIVIPPPIELGAVIASDENDKQFITMFNPNLKKGGEIFREVALRMPDHHFAGVSGWDILKKGEETDTEIVRRLCDSLRIEYKGQRLDDVSLDDLKNVRKFIYTNNVSEIYAQTRILCIPSQWQEAFGRVSIEGMANSIPVLGSNVGGLAEIVQKGGILITDFKNPDAWVEELKRLDNPEVYGEIAQKGRSYVERSYNYTTVCDNFFRIIEGEST